MNHKPLQAARLYLIMGLALVCATCAREEMPPGTGPDFEAPQVVEMFPAPGSAVPDLDEDAYARFDEPIADPRSVARTLETSPAWRYEVNAGRRNVRIRPVDGWRPGVVYSFRIPPGLADLVRNQTRTPIEFLFTTGAKFYDTRAAGQVWDRETVRKVRDIAIQVLGADSTPYAAVTDTGGNFALRGLPVGDYWAFAFRDQNRNRTLERDFEPHDSGRVALADSAAVVELELWLTMPDSTPPVLGSVEARDSLNLRLNFDDLLEPEASLEKSSVRVTQGESREEWSVADFVIGDMYATIPEADDAGLDSLGAGELEVAAEIEPVPTAEPADLAAGETDEAQAEQEARPRPQRYVTVRLSRALEAGVFEVSASGFWNLRGLSGGGDTTFVYEPPPPITELEADEVQLDGEEAQVDAEGAEIDEEGGR